MELKTHSLYYYSLLLFVSVAPFSAALISIATVVCFISAIVTFEKGAFEAQKDQRIYYLFPFAVFIIQVISFCFTSDVKSGLHDLQKQLPYFLFPLGFLLAPALSRKQMYNLFKLFSLAVFLAALIAMGGFYWEGKNMSMDTQFGGFIHHIRFSQMILLAVSFLLVYLIGNWKGTERKEKIFISGTVSFLIVFLLWHQSLTGIVTLVIILAISNIYFLFQVKRFKSKLALSFVFAALVCVPFFMTYTVIRDFYKVDEVNPEQLPQMTASGNYYLHDSSNPFTENGHFVGLYQCETELRLQWNRRSKKGFDSETVGGYKLSDTVIRYLTSRNLTKDSVGISSLTDREIGWIEDGVSNYKLVGRSFPLYSRIYVTVWEIDQYLKTGNAEGKSVVQRWEYAKAAISVWKSNFWFGAGVGNWKKAFQEEYKRMDTTLTPDKYGHAHNQYLAWLSRLGIVGTIMIFFCLSYPVVKLKTYKNPLAVLFLLILLISNFGDSNLDTHEGGFTLMFFYCLLLFPPSFGNMSVND